MYVGLLCRKESGVVYVCVGIRDSRMFYPWKKRRDPKLRDKKFSYLVILLFYLKRKWIPREIKSEAENASVESSTWRITNPSQDLVNYVVIYLLIVTV